MTYTRRPCKAKTDQRRPGGGGVVIADPCWQEVDNRPSIAQPPPRQKPSWKATSYVGVTAWMGVVSKTSGDGRADDQAVPALMLWCHDEQ